MDELAGKLSFILYTIAFLYALVEYIRGRRISVAFYFFVLSLVANILALVIRGVLAGHLPFTGRYEALIIYTCMISSVVLCLVLIFRYKSLILYVTPLILILLLVALTAHQRTPGPLAPALRTPLFGIHVVLIFLGYAFYTTNFCLAVCTDTSQRDVVRIIRSSVEFGVLFLGAGIAIGALWAHLSWGSWWSWDPKETWALITFLFYFSYLHTEAELRLKRGFVVVFLIAGYMSLVITFLGINLSGWSIHSY